MDTLSAQNDWGAQGATQSADYPKNGYAHPVIMVDEEESSWQRIKDRLTATPIIQDILGAGSESVRTFAKTDAGKQARKSLRKGRNKLEDLQEQWETSQNPYVFAVASAAFRPDAT